MNNKKSEYLQTIKLTMLAYNLKIAIDEHNRSLESLALDLSQKSGNICKLNKVRKDKSK